MSTKRKGKKRVENGQKLKNHCSCCGAVAKAQMLFEIDAWSGAVERKLRRLVVFADYSNISCHFRSINKALRNNLGAVGVLKFNKGLCCLHFSLSSVD